MYINDKYYDGFEGEPKITFCLMENGLILEAVGIWGGYFNAIIRLVRPEEKGWTGLAYFYHLYIGWYEEDNWLIPNISEAYGQLANIDANKLEYQQEKEVLIIIVNLLERAIKSNLEVSIIYD